MRVAILDDIHDAWAGTDGGQRLRERTDELIAFLEGREMPRFASGH